MQWGAVRFISVIVAASALAATKCEPRSTPKPTDDEKQEAQSRSPEPADHEQQEGQWRPPEPAASKERVDERRRMVLGQIAEPRDGREPIKDKEVLEAMRTAPRHVFVPKARKRWAYADSPLPIGHGQTISQPYIVALMTERLELTPTKKVLEIGTGSGYQAAVLAQLTPHVYTIEIIEPLAERSAEALKGQGYKSINTRCADGYFGWKEHGPFDAIIVTCAAGHLPPPLWEQLKPGGRIVVPIGGPYEIQRLVVITKTDEGKRKSKTITAVRFVPLTRREQ